MGFPAPLRSSSRITKRCFVTYETHDSHFFTILLKFMQKCVSSGSELSCAARSSKRCSSWRRRTVALFPRAPPQFRAPRRSVCLEWNCISCVQKQSACYRTANVRVIYHQTSRYGARKSKECRCRSCFAPGTVMCPDTQLSAGQGRAGLQGTMSLLRSGVPQV